MTDRFKFRAWDTHCNRMRYEEDYAVVPDTGKPHWIHDQELIQGEATQLILMQCTGLKDVEGKLIYEGDLIQEDSLQTIYEVRFDNVEWIKYILVDKSAGYRVLNTKKSYKIVGNIYETIQE